MSPVEKVNLREKLGLFDEYWTPKLVGELNGQHVRLAKLKGEFVWHRHEEEDEMFLVLSGEIRIDLRESQVRLSEGEIAIIPRGVDHRPVADQEAHVLLFEPATTVNSGERTSEKYSGEPERI